MQKVQFHFFTIKARNLYTSVLIIKVQEYYIMDSFNIPILFFIFSIS